jgi:SET domain
MNIKVENYLEYLDKEMTIAGVLTTFCLAIPALLFERIVSVDEKSITYQFFVDLWNAGLWYLISRLPNEIKKLYKDFCVKKGNKYICPISFNKLTPAWFLNHSDDPNVAADSDYRFYAIRNIKKGEELTANYHTYSE